MIVDTMRCLGGEGRHRALVGAEAVLDGQRLPRALFLVLPHAVGVAAGVSHGRHAHGPGRGAPHVGDDEPQGPADGRVGAPPGPEGAATAVDVQSGSSGTVDDEEGRVEIRGGRDAVEIEGILTHGLDPGDHHRQVIRTAPGHHGIDGDLLDGGPSEIGRHQRDELVGLAARARDHGLHPLAGRRHHGEAIGDAALEERLEGIGSGRGHGAVRVCTGGSSRSRPARSTACRRSPSGPRCPRPSKCRDRRSISCSPRGR